MSRYARRKDTSQKAIAEALEAAGCIVFDLTQTPPFDLIAYDPRSDRWLPFEAKTRHYARGKAALPLRPSQVKALARAPIPIVENGAQALAHFAETKGVE